MYQNATDYVRNKRNNFFSYTTHAQTGLHPVDPPIFTSHFYDLAQARSYFASSAFFKK